jgi:hypothetical protein
MYVWMSSASPASPCMFRPLSPPCSPTFSPSPCSSLPAPSPYPLPPYPPPSPSFPYSCSRLSLPPLFLPPPLLTVPPPPGMPMVRPMMLQFPGDTVRECVSSTPLSRRSSWWAPTGSSLPVTTENASTWPAYLPALEVGDGGRMGVPLEGRGLEQGRWVGGPQTKRCGHSFGMAWDRVV